MFLNTSFRLMYIVFFYVKYIICEDDYELMTDVEDFSPCENNILTMERIIGGPPKLENYWDGTIFLFKWPNLTEIRISIALDHAASIKIDPNVGRVWITGTNEFSLRTFDAVEFIKFRIRGDPFRPFPNVKEISLNGADICPNPKKWNPTIYGRVDYDSGEDSKCGKRIINHEGLIANGYPSREGDWPWHAAIYHVYDGESTYVCGGTLLNSYTVLTAAHCLQRDGGTFLLAEQVTIQLGRYNLRYSGKNTQDILVHKIIPHENYNYVNHENDIALLRFTTEVNLNNFVIPICMWEREHSAIEEVLNRYGTVVGWGLNEFNQESEELSQANLPVISITSCLRSNRKFFGLSLSDNNFCAGSRNGTSVCNGDTGGGLFFEENGKYRIRGIISLTVNRGDQTACNTEDYVVFTDVARYIDWIEATLAHPSTRN